jgi:hypothetical protein
MQERLQLGSLLPIWLLPIALLAGCHQASLIQKMIPPRDELAARSYIDQLRQNHLEQIAQAMDPTITDGDTPSKLSELAQDFPGGEPLSVKVVGVQIARNPGLSKPSLTFEYEFPETWLLAEITLQDTDGKTTIASLHVQRIENSLEETNRFTLTGKGSSQYEVLLYILLSLSITT